MLVIYMDVWVLMNFWMDLLLLFLVRYITRQYRTLWCLLAALCGAAASSVVLLLFLKGCPALLCAVFAAAMAVLENRIAFGKERLPWHCLLFALAGGLVCATEFGVLSALRLSGLPQGGATDAAAVLFVCATSFVGCVLLEKGNRVQWKEEHMKAKVLLEYGERKLLATALVDTGNRLYDPFFHRPVILVEEALLEDFLTACGKEHPERMQYVPFRSVGREHGMLSGMLLDRVTIRWQGKTWRFPEVIAAAAKGRLCRGKEYQVIFHCGLFEEEPNGMSRRGFQKMEIMGR